MPLPSPITQSFATGLLHGVRKQKRPPDMAIHPKDRSSSDNPRLQCSVCGKWKRVRMNKGNANRPDWHQSFYGGCTFTNGDHLAGDHLDVCVDCCDTKCKHLAEITAEGAPEIEHLRALLAEAGYRLEAAGVKSEEERRDGNG